jgi:hypothetical protein
VKRRVTRLGLLLAALAAAVVPWGAHAQPPKPTLIVETEAVRLENVAPGSRWLVMGYGRKLTTPVSVAGYFQWHLLADESNAGKLELDLAEAPVPPLSVWAAFEISTGKLLTVTQDEGLPAPSESSVPADQPISLADLGGSESLLFLLRQGQGGWVWTGQADLTAAVENAPAVLRPLPKSFAPVSDAETALAAYQPGDLFLAIDQGDLAVTVTRLQ